MYNLTDSAAVRSLLTKHGFNFSKGLGQNFIIDPEICPDMVEMSGINREYGVIEIGPGIGVLTRELCLRAGKVVSIEIDKRLLPILGETVGGFENLKIINADVLKTDLKRLIADEFGDMPVCVCANLPYYITSPVIMDLLEKKPGLEFVTVMVQKEWADRIISPVGSREAGAVTAAVNYYSEPKKLFNVSKNSFMPAPKVDSSVIKMDIRSAPPVGAEDEKFFFSVVKSAFGQRRKTAVNSLSSGLGISKEIISAALAECGFEPTVRAETMTMEQFCDLSNCILRKSRAD